ncbi:HIT family protein [Ferrimicrobium acidiphilum]|uniref:HIT family protein n=1 Tax=Ferrimicrobium acidiphilum TaxID=121039 RepID=UPI0023F1C6E6|nr:HIT family protein [Ferrimicrobium acidiphilum]MCL5052824.1 HIT family protein [Gammaproteobacteria bacterium]
MSCPFCDLINHPDDPHVIEVGAHTSVLLDRAPVFLGHALIVPTAHVEHLLVADPEVVIEVMRRSQEVAIAAMDAYRADGILTVTNTIVSQSVPHLHVHVIARHQGDGLRGFLWPRKRYSSQEELLEYRDRLRGSLVGRSPYASD